MISGVSHEFTLYAHFSNANYSEVSGKIGLECIVIGYNTILSKKLRDDNSNLCMLHDSIQGVCMILVHGFLPM